MQLTPPTHLVTPQENQAMKSDVLSINPLQPGVAYLYTLETSENVYVYMFSGSTVKEHWVVMD